jgi:2-dehydropantoate 2-reductase
MPKGDNEPILVVGTGAMACLFAARLVAAGAPVVMLGSWAQGLQALQRDGVCVIQANGQERYYPVRAVAEPQDCGRLRYALVLVKSWQTARVARQLAECLDAEGLALTLQNGLGNFEQLVQTLGSERVALGVTTAGATLLGPGRVRPVGEARVTLSEHPRLPPLADILQAAAFSVEAITDAVGLLWGKLVINAAINPLTALMGVLNGELLERPSARQLMQAVALEAAAVAAAQGIHLPYSDPAAAAEAVARRTAANRSSMLQDMQRHAPTEIDAICGAIVQAGEQVNVPTPLNRALLYLVKALAQEGGQASRLTSDEIQARSP